MFLMHCESYLISLLSNPYNVYKNKKKIVKYVDSNGILLIV